MYTCIHVYIRIYVYDYVYILSRLKTYCDPDLGEIASLREF